MPKKPGYITRQAERLSAGQINRRRFVASALSAGVTLPTALSLASRAEAGTPKPGGHLRLALASKTSFTDALAFAQGNTLTEITASGEVIGELAELETTDATRWIAKLRKDVTFHDGQPLTCKDVLATFDRHTLTGATLDATGPHEVVFTLAQPDPDFPRRLADPRFVIRHADTGLGTGAYRLEHIERGTAELTRNPDYWKPGRAHFETVEIKVTPDASRRHIALTTGEADYADEIDPRSVALLQRDTTILETPGSRHLALSVPDATLIDALALAIDDQLLVDRLLFGHGRPGDTPFDPNKAVQLYRSSGHIGPIPLEKPADPALREAARLIVTSAKAAGIDVTPQIDGCTLAFCNGTPNPNTLVPLWLNDIAAHSKALTYAADETVSPRLIERWWFS